MKKKIQAVIMFAVVALVACVNVYHSQRTVDMSDVALANVEALAGEEWDGDNTCHMDETFWVCLKYAEGVGCYCGL